MDKLLSNTFDAIMQQKNLDSSSVSAPSSTSCMRDLTREQNNAKNPASVLRASWGPKECEAREEDHQLKPKLAAEMRGQIKLQDSSVSTDSLPSRGLEEVSSGLQQHVVMLKVNFHVPLGRVPKTDNRRNASCLRRRQSMRDRCGQSWRSESSRCRSSLWRWKRSRGRRWLLLPPPSSLFPPPFSLLPLPSSFLPPPSSLLLSPSSLLPSSSLLMVSAESAARAGALTGGRNYEASGDMPGPPVGTRAEGAAGAGEVDEPEDECCARWSKRHRHAAAAAAASTSPLLDQILAEPAAEECGRDEQAHGGGCRELGAADG
eukprot:754531-Hanusia_phi.AAC.2